MRCRSCDNDSLELILDQTSALSERWYAQDADMYFARKVKGFPINYLGVF